MKTLKIAFLGLGLLSCFFAKAQGASDEIVEDVSSPSAQSRPLPPPPPPPQEETPSIFVVVEEMPYPSSCEGNEDLNFCRDQKMMEYVYANINYPSIAREAGIEGFAVVSFVIDKGGSIIDVEIMRDPGGGCGAEAKRVVTLMGEEMEWESGKHMGKNVSVCITIPISFSLKGNGYENNGSGGVFTSNPEKMPLYPKANSDEDGEELWNVFVLENMRYPDDAYKSKVEGNVAIWFIVNKLGLMENYKIVYSDSELLEIEAIRLVQQLGKSKSWTPAIHKGEVVRTPIVLVVEFNRKKWKRAQRKKK